MARACIFCGRSGSLTLEHVYPDWLSSYFSKTLKGTNEVKGDDIHRVWQGTVFQHKVKLVCSDCNNGWMSSIETDTKELLSSLIFTHDPHALSREDQRKIALWVQKTVLVDNKAIGGNFHIPSSFYEKLYAEKQPLPNIMVGMGWRVLVNGLKDQPLASFEIKQVSTVQVEKNSVEAINAQMDDGKMIWAASLGLGNVVFQIVGTDLLGQLEVSSSDPRIFPPINPYVEDLSWPTEWPIEAVGGLQGVRSGMY